MLFAAGAAVAVITTIVAGFLSESDVDRARRVFWFGWLAGGAVVALTFRPPEGKDAVVAITWMVFAWIYAYFRTPFIKIGDRIYAFTLAQRGVDPPPDAYGQ